MGLVWLRKQYYVCLYLISKKIQWHRWMWNIGWNIGWNKGFLWKGFEKENPSCLLTYSFWEWQEKDRKKWRKSSRGRRKLLGFGEYWDVQQHPTVSPNCSTTTKSCFFLLHSMCPAATHQGGLFSSGVCGEPPPPSTLAERSSIMEHFSSQPDHRLAMLGSTHQPSTYFNFFTLCYLHSFQTKFSDHYLPTHFHTSSILQRHSDKVTSTQPLTVTHQNQRQTWHWCLGWPTKIKGRLALGSLGRAKLSLQGSASQNSSERLKGFSKMTKRGVTAVTPDTRESNYHVVNHPAWQLGSGISWFSAQTHSWSHWWPYSSS